MTHVSADPHVYYTKYSYKAKQEFGGFIPGEDKFQTAE